MGLANGAFKLKSDLLGGLGLLSEDGLGLSIETRLTIISSLSLSREGIVTLLILGDLVD